MKILIVLVLVLSTFTTLSGATIIFGVNDNGSDGDYADLVFRVTGDFKLVASCAPGQSSCNPTGQWLPMVAPDGNLVPFWDGISLDGPNMNIGHLMLNIGGFAGNPASPNWSLLTTQYFGAPGGGAAGFYLAPDGAGASTATLLLEISGLSAQNILKKADVGSSSYATIFSGPNSAGATYSFLITGPTVLALENNLGTVTSNGTMQIAAFQSVPEPMSFILMGAGLVGIAALRRRHSA